MKISNYFYIFIILIGILLCLGSFILYYLFPIITLVEMLTLIVLSFSGILLSVLFKKEGILNQILAGKTVKPSVSSILIISIIALAIGIIIIFELNSGPSTKDKSLPGFLFSISCIILGFLGILKYYKMRGK